MIAGERSGVGKTTVTLALLACLQQYGSSTQSFKVGPDYIDPMFHRYVTGRPCRNLDPVLTSEAYVQECFAQHTQAVAYALVEGVMGLFDGAPGEGVGGLGNGDWEKGSGPKGGMGSTAHVACLLDLPILLVLDCSRMSQSIAALVHGYTTFDPSLRFAGLVLNRVGSDRHLNLLQAALAPLDLPILGVLRRHEMIAIPDRHLGLLPTAELPELDLLLRQLAHLAEKAFDWKQLLPLLKQAAGGRRQAIEVSHPLNMRSSLPTLSAPRSPLPAPAPSSSSRPIRIAIADDAAFSFYYEDNLDLLKALGAELIFWSPLQDEALPTGVQGLIFGGGFPEMFAAQLTANQGGRLAVRQAIAAGMPTYAECGGLMYLCQEIVDFAGNAWEMVGVLPSTAVMGKQLTLGYRQGRSLQTGVMLEQGAIAIGHEFHRSHLTEDAQQPLWQLAAQHTQEGWYGVNLHASYLHLHWGALPALPRRFLNHCSQFQLLAH